MSFILSLYPQTVLRKSSHHNADIRVIREWVGYKLLVNGSPQSGSYIRMLWSRAIRKFRIDRIQHVDSILVLGVGGGTVIEMLAKHFPNASITAIEIDQVIIRIAKQYFEIDKHPNVHLVRADANAYVRELARKKKVFDLVIVDVFIGPKIPEFVSLPTFLNLLQAITQTHGCVLINYLRELEYQEKSDALIVRLRALWRYVEDMKLYNNRFFLART